MSSEWPLVRLGDLISLKGGFAYKGDHLGSHGAVLLGMGVVSHSERFIKNGIRRYSGEIPSPHRVVAGDMVIATRQQSDNLPILGCPALVPTGLPSDEVVVGTNLYKVTNTSEVETQFLYWLLRGKEYQRRIVDCSKGTTVRMITKDAVEDFCFLCPPSEIRKEITDLLDAIDNRITLLRETNTALEAIAQAMFKSWFVDFDPVHAKMQGRAPECMDEATAALFPDSFEESALGAVPTGWNVVNIYEVAKVIYGAPFASKQFKSDPHGKPLVRIRDLKDERPGVYTEEVHPKGYLLQPGDITVGMDGEFRAYVWGGEEAWLNQRVCVFQPVNGANSVFVRLSIAPLLAAVEASETATTVIHLGKNDIDRFKILHPGGLLLKSFVSVTTPIYQRVVRNKQMIQNLAGLRDTLLPRLISGQLSVTQATAEADV